MGILSDAYKICKEVKCSPSRNAIQQVIFDINHVSKNEQGEEIDRGSSGLMARHQCAQIMGYLIIDQRRTELESRPLPPIVPLRDDERQALAGVHAMIVQLNTECIFPMAAALPWGIAAVNPYDAFGYTPPETFVPSDILSLDSLQTMAKSFHQHPVFSVLIREIASLNVDSGVQHWPERVQQLVDEIQQAGVLSAPRDLNDVTRRFGPRSRERTVVRVLAALGCLRASLATLDQMIYQAILHDKLLMLNEENMINLSHRVNHLIGTGLRITYQPGEEPLPEPPDLVLVKCSSLSSPIDAVCRIERMRVEVSRALGETVELDLRLVDDNLNPFGGLLDYL